MKSIVTEIAWFFFMCALMLMLLPGAVQMIDARSSMYTINKLEKYFLIELSILIFLVMLVGGYLLRFVVMLVMKWIRAWG
jgi:hypothetical protein